MIILVGCETLTTAPGYIEIMPVELQRLMTHAKPTKI